MKLTVVVGFKDRDTSRVKRWSESLAQQSFTDFNVKFVDYGSQRALQAEVRDMLRAYDFCEYIYTETRGYFWNRSQALNIGARRAEGEYIATTDIDMIYERNFLEVVATHADPQKDLHAFHYFLPRRFRDWDNITDYRDRLPNAGEGALGAFMCISRAVYQETGGFDEYYRYWGTEDQDLQERLSLLNIHLFNLNPYTAMYHQWHRRADYWAPHFPDGAFGRMRTHLIRQRGIVPRNGENWGRVLTAEDRPVFQFMDVDAQKLHPNDVQILDLPPESNQSVMDFAEAFYNLPSGQALALHHAGFPRVSRRTGALLRITRRLGPIGYTKNRLHAFLVDFIELNPDLVRDYYLNLQGGVSVVVKA